MYQIASLYELLGDMGQAVEWYFQVIGLVPTDPAILQKMATIYDNDGDKQQAYQYYFDSYRYKTKCSRRGCENSFWEFLPVSMAIYGNSKK